MADKAVGDLLEATVLNDDSLLVMEQNGEARKIKGKVIKDYVAPYATAAQNANTAAQSALSGIKTAINNIPDGSTPIVNDLTTGGTKMALSAEMGKVLGRRSNPYLIDNYDFTSPINQRGVLSLMAGTSGYFIDRWRSNGAGVVSVSSGAYLFMAAGAILYQVHEVDIWGGSGATLTVSYQKASTGEVFSKTATFSSYTAVGDISVSINHSTKTIYIRAEVDMSMTRIKVELGSIQTFAYQDANGNWRLNDPPPNKQQELAKCQRYQLVLDGLALYRAVVISADTIDIFIPTPVPMRSNPSITYNGAKYVYSWGDNTAYSDFTWPSNGLTKSNVGIYVRVTKTSHGLTEARFDLGSGTILDANL